MTDLNRKQETEEAKGGQAPWEGAGLSRQVECVRGRRFDQKTVFARTGKRRETARMDQSEGSDWVQEGVG